MSPGPPDDDSGAIPPEVPEEFAAVYRRAYEEALAARPTEVGTHRLDPPEREERVRSGYERLRNSWAFVPVLLAVLVLLLLSGAFVLGRLFVARIGG